VTALLRFLRDRRRAAIWWTVGVIGLVAFTAAFWPTVRGQTSFDQVLDDMPEAMRAMFGIDAAVSISSAPGYLHGRVFATLLPLILIVDAIGLGAATVAGSEDDGTLELVLANPISRLRLATERGGAALILLATPALTAGAALLAIGGPVGLLDGVSVTGLVGATLAAFALALLFGAIAFAVGAATGRRSLAVSVPAGAAVATYLVQGLVSAVDGPDAVLDLTPWHWYLEDNMLLAGPSLTAILVPILFGAALACGGLVLFNRRDLT
jgi:ABC-2 type transport system permease protein